MPIELDEQYQCNWEMGLILVVVVMAVVVVGEWDMEEECKVEDSVKNNTVLMEYDKSVLLI